jgi:hypothetical protein
VTLKKQVEIATLIMRFLKLAMAVIIAVNGFFLTSAGSAGALPLCSFGVTTSPPTEPPCSPRPQ